MAKSKVGLSYYNVDTDRYQDIRIKRLKKDFGCNGLAVYDYILCEIYRVKGCFLVWDESTAFDVADYLGLKETLVNEIVSYCGAVGLFHKELLTRERVLTSLSIQTRYRDFCVRAKRTKIDIPEEYAILPEKCAITTEESGNVQEDCPEVKKSKVKRSKESDEGRVALPREGGAAPELGYAPAPSLPLEDLYRLLVEPSSPERPWLVSVANLHHLDSAALGGYLISFFKHLRADGVASKRLADFKKHFNAWLRIQLEVAKRSPSSSDEWDQLLREAQLRVSQ
jgi:hypothetical protein